MERTAKAVWQGTLKEGKGKISTESGVLSDTPYSFKMRFEGQPGTNPEELIAAAHAACFTMALSGQLTAAGIPPELLTTTATLTMEKLEAGFTISKIHLSVLARCPGANREDFEKAATTAKANCPVSRVLNAEITMSASLE